MSKKILIIQIVFQLHKILNKMLIRSQNFHLLHFQNHQVDLLYVQIIYVDGYQIGLEKEIISISFCSLYILDYYFYHYSYGE